LRLLGRRLDSGQLLFGKEGDDAQHHQQADKTKRSFHVVPLR
jgi:hypothetical protein